MTKLAVRLKDERQRLGLSQAAIGEIGGVKKLTQLNYEKGDRFPDEAYLSALDKIGIDVQYIVTGRRSAQALSQDEEQLISLFRAAPLAVKAAIMAGLAAGGSSPVGNVTNTNSSDGVQQNFVGSTVGNVTTGDVIVGKGKKKT